MQSLKKKITQLSSLEEYIDQNSRSKLRILIETLLIDINEELFTLSEEITKIFKLDKSVLSNINNSNFNS